jgi:hypothetical protein
VQNVKPCSSHSGAAASDVPIRIGYVKSRS